MHRTLVAIGLGFAAVAAFGAYVWWRVARGPGDDNPIGGLALLVAVTCGALALGCGLLAALLAKRAASP
jgi:hypothetical protein